jgi:hypothetical protein
LAVAGSILALTVLAQTASSGSAFQPLSLTKECAKPKGGIPTCTVTNSSLSAIPVGAKIFYYGPVTDSPAFLSSSVVLDAGNGNTAVGYCNVDRGANPKLGMCAFWSGSGSLSGLQAIVKVTVDANKFWHWDGSYILSPSQ